MKHRLGAVLLGGLLSTTLILPARALTRPDESGLYWDPDQVAAGVQISPATQQREPVFAVPEVDCNGDGRADCFYPGSGRYEVRYTPRDLREGDCYRILLRQGDSLRTEHLLYFYEATVSAEDVKNGFLVFDVLPSALRSATLLLQGPGAAAPLNMATISVFFPGSPGDADGDGAVTMLDELAVLQQISGQTVLSGAGQAAADMDGDGSITASDAFAILQYLVSGAPLE